MTDFIKVNGRVERIEKVNNDENGLYLCVIDNICIFNPKFRKYYLTEKETMEYNEKMDNVTKEKNRRKKVDYARKTGSFKSVLQEIKKGNNTGVRSEESRVGKVRLV